MGDPIDVYLWTALAISTVVALVGHATIAGRIGLYAAGVFFALWLAWTLFRWWSNRPQK